ncbi:MAG: hypothetical protein ACNA71_04235 [Kiritimatiellia bacterium]
MKTSRQIACLATILLSTAIASEALTPPKESIESVAFTFANYTNHDILGGAIQAFVPAYRGQNRIFFAAELHGGTLRQSRGASYDTIGLELGLNYQLFPITSLMVSGSHDWYLGSPDFRISAANLRIRQALLANDAPVVPFVRANGSLQFIDPVAESPARQDDSYRLIVIEALAGVEIRIRKEFRWVFEAGRSQSQAINNGGPDIADGWVGRIAMQYDWF